jgi:non-ribosomal peptide synthetase component F
VCVAFPRFVAYCAACSILQGRWMYRVDNARWNDVSEYVWTVAIKAMRLTRALIVVLWAAGWLPACRPAAEPNRVSLTDSAGVAIVLSASPMNASSSRTAAARPYCTSRPTAHIWARLGGRAMAQPNSGRSRRLAKPRATQYGPTTSRTTGSLSLRRTPPWFAKSAFVLFPVWHWP